MRNELEAALQQTTESLSQATRLLALVSAPAVDIAVVRHVEVLQLQPGVVLIVVITATGGITKRLVELDEAVDAGLVEWAREYLNETVARASSRRGAAAAAFRGPVAGSARARLPERTAGLPSRT